ncbi:MAG TPA: YfhO family protein [Acidimicrobiales bacterium]|nr:YfhO family protein [Acidimicrobiales bacterium]
MDILGLFVLCVLAFAFLAPSLKDGFAFGNYDLDLALTQLTQGIFPSIHSPFNGDAVSQMIAWNTLDWQMIHHGQFPLWNHYNLLGMPQFLNFESSVLSLPDIVSYLFPLKFAFLVVVYVKLALAGTGAFVFARVLGQKRISGLFAGATFMLSGAFASWVTWPLSDVVAWSGWVFAFAVLAYRNPKLLRYVAGLAVVIALSVYGGFPEANVMLGSVLALALVIGGAAKLFAHQKVSLRGCVNLLAGSLFGIMLSAPLWIPGYQVILAGHRTNEGHYVGLPVRALPLLFAQGYYGLPVGRLLTHFQLTRWNYYETVAYVGVAALVFAVLAVLRGWQRPAVLGLFTALLFSLALTYEPVRFHPLQSLTYHIFMISTIRFERMRIVTAFLVAMLAGFGVDALLTTWSRRKTKIAYLASAVLGAAAVGIVGLNTLSQTLVDNQRSIRLASLEWPLTIAFVLVMLGLIGLSEQRRMFVRAAVLVTLFAQVAYLYFAGVGIPTYSHSVYPSTAAVKRLQSIVGTSLVGLDGGNTGNVRLFGHVGFYPNVNIGYHIRLFAVHDPLVPNAYFLSWPNQLAAPQKFGVGLFTPDIDTAALARRYGISYVLVAPGLVVPQGMSYVTTIADERLYFVSRSAQFSVVQSGKHPSEEAVTSVADNANGRYSFAIDVSTKLLSPKLIMRVTDTPGWHLSVDGHLVGIYRYEQVMMSAALTPGRHQIVLWYWPKRLGDGIVLALGSVVAFALALALRKFSLRRPRPGAVN